MKFLAFPILSALIVALSPTGYAQPESPERVTELEEKDLLAIQKWECWSDEKPTLRRYLKARAYELLDAREEEIGKLKSRRAWKRRIAKAKKRYMDILSPMPERSPLNPRITGRDETEYCRFEKVLFESRPEMYVTACLFIPKDLKEPRPAVLYVCGHTADGYRAGAYQHVILNLVKKGFVVLAMDPVGQGERLMYYDPEQKKSIVRPGTGEHSYVGKQCFLTGNPVANYFTWDMVRALDYMETRPEVDASRIAVQGRSGGGTQSSLLMAFDDRVALAGPECYLTSIRRLLESFGTQDAEQILYRGLAEGLDHADFVEIRAPKPTLFVVTTNDFFSITGAHETFAEAQKCYRALGAEKNLVLAHDDGPHASTLKNRESFYRFLSDQFEFPCDTADEPLEPLAAERLNVTETGQLLGSVGGRTVFDLNRDYAEELCTQVVESRAKPKAHVKTVRAEAQRLSGYVEPEPCEENPVMTHRNQLKGYRVDTWMIPGDRESWMPALVAVPDGVGEADSAPLKLLFPAEGKGTQLELLESLALAGNVVISADLMGIGETQSGNREYMDPHLAFWMGISVVGVRAEQISRCVDFALQLPGSTKEGLSAYGSGAAGTALLHAAAFDKRIQRTAVADSLFCYQRVVMNQYHEMDSSGLVAGALTAYDLPDLVGAIAPRAVLIAGAIDSQSEVLDAADVERGVAFARRCYTSQFAPAALQVCQKKETQRTAVLKAWMLER